MSSRSLARTAALAALFVLPSLARAEESAATEASATPEPKTVTATKGPFTPSLEVTGAFEPEGAVEVAFRPKAFGGDLEVVEAAGSGPVSKGAVLVRFDLEKIDDQIRAGEAEQAVGVEHLARLVEEGRLAQEAADVALARTGADAKRSEEALKTFREVEAPLRRLETAHRVQGTRDHIQDQEEELAQLLRMYSADEITEETEEIVLKRSKRQLERSRTSLGFLLERQRLLLEVELPREEENLEIGRRKAKVDWERTKATAPIGVAQSRVELEKAKGALERQKTALERLKADREAMTMVAPVAGVAVAGSFWDGKWHGLDDLAKALRPGRRAPANQPLYTVFDPRAVRIRIVVGEAAVLRIRPDAAATVALTSDPTVTTPARVSAIAPVSGDGQYEIHLKPERLDPRTMPGHTCKVTIAALDRRDGVTVPTTAIQKQGEKHLVHVWDDGKPVAKEVKVGGAFEGRTEIVDGLEAGARVLETAPPK